VISREFEIAGTGYGKISLGIFGKTPCMGKSEEKQ
jgi:hypothetical protein